MICANNCKGVDPNAIIVGGTAILGATATVGVGILIPPFLGALTLGGAIANGMCLLGTCNVSDYFVQLIWRMMSKTSIKIFIHISGARPLLHDSDGWGETALPNQMLINCNNW